MLRQFTMLFAALGLSLGTLAATATTVTDPVLTNLRLWLKADSGVVADANNRVGMWLDQSGSGNDFAQATVGQQPLLALNDDSHQVIRFDGIDDLMSNGAQIIAGTSLTIFVVSQLHAGAYPWALGTTVNDRLGYEGSPNGGVPDTNSFDVFHDFGNDRRATLPGIGDATFKVLTITGSGLMSSVEVFVDGVAATVVNVGSDVASDFSPGNTFGFVHSAASFTRVDFAEFLVYDAALSPTDRQATQAYLAAKFNPVPLGGTFAYLAVGVAGLMRACRRRH